MQTRSSERWHKLEGDDAAAQVVAICDALERDVGSVHRTRWFDARTLYESRPLVDETMLANGVRQDADLYNLLRSAVDTAQAEIASRQRPKPMFLTTGADWRTKRKAKKLDRFVEAWFHQRQGARYADVWELGEDVFRDAQLAVAGVIKVVADVARKRIRYERIPAYEILVDPYEARGGDPRNWFHVYEMDVDVAISTFTEGKDEAEALRIRGVIEGSAGFRRNSASASAGEWRATQSVTIFEAWWLSPDANADGKHAFATRGGMLHEEPWTWPRVPFAVLTWSKEPFGIWGVGLGESSAKQHQVVNDLAARMHNRFVLNAHRRTYYKPGTVNLEAMQQNDAEVFVSCTDMAQIPQEREVPPVTPAETTFVETEIRRFYEVSGISQMSANQRKEPGVDAAVAMQTLNDIKSVRFLTKARAYELMFVELGELTVLAARDIAENGGLTVNWPGKRFLRTIDWKDVDAANDTYTVRVAPVSSMSRDPAQRLQIVEQLSRMGYLPRDKYLQLLQLPDLETLMESEGKESEWIEQIVERFLDAENDTELDELGGWEQPDGYLSNPVAALALVGQHYFAALVDDVPAYNADLLRDFMRALQDLVEPPNQVAPQETPNLAPGITPPPGSPGAPMGGPGPGPVPAPPQMLGNPMAAVA